MSDAHPDAANIREDAHGHWLDILPALAPVLADACTRPGKHVPCPVHGGKDGYRFFLQAGFAPVQRINVPLTWEQFAGFDVKEARQRKRMLGVVRDLLVMRKGAG